MSTKCLFLGIGLDDPDSGKHLLYNAGQLTELGLNGLTPLFDQAAHIINRKRKQRKWQQGV